MPAGRPTLYRKEFGDIIIEKGKEGKSINQMALAMGVHKDTLYEWVKVYPEFSDCFKLAVAYSQGWWEDFGQANMATNTLNAAIYNKQMATRFRQDYAEITRTELSGPNGTPIETKVISAEDEALIKQYYESKFNDKSI